MPKENQTKIIRSFYSSNTYDYDSGGPCFICAHCRFDSWLPFEDCPCCGYEIINYKDILKKEGLKDG